MSKAVLTPGASAAGIAPAGMIADRYQRSSFQNFSRLRPSNLTLRLADGDQRRRRQHGRRCQRARAARRQRAGPPATTTAAVTSRPAKRSARAPRGPPAPRASRDPACAVRRGAARGRRRWPRRRRSRRGSAASRYIAAMFGYWNGPLARGKPKTRTLRRGRARAPRSARQAKLGPQDAEATTPPVLIAMAVVKAAAGGAGDLRPRRRARCRRGSATRT